MKLTLIRIAGLALLTIGAMGCTAEVEYQDDVDPSSSTGSSSGEPGVMGIPCAYLLGEATLTRYEGDNYGTSAFNFELASQDADVTNNEFNLLYGRNTFSVNLVTDDDSFIVDLGNLPLDEVPETVDPDDFPLGQFGEHDHIDAILDHTYYVRSQDSSGRHVAAFRVLGLEPGVRVTIRWARSTDPDRMQLPIACGL